MATRVEEKQLESKGSDETIDICCSACLEDGISKEARKYCLDCDMHYCDQCLKIHDKIPSSRSHQTMDKSGSDMEGSPRPTQLHQCLAHHGNIMDMFCGDHFVVCCRSCVVLNHRSCVKVEKLVDVSKGIKQRQEYKDVDKDVSGVLQKLQQEKDKRLQSLTSLQQHKETLLRKVDKTEDVLKMKIKEIATESRKVVCAQETELRKGVDKEIESLDTILDTLTKSKQLLSCQDEVQCFVTVNSARNVVMDGKSLLQEFSEKPVFYNLKVRIDLTLQNTVDNLTSFTCIDTEERWSKDNVKEYKANFAGKYRVSDSLTDITAVCFLEDSSLVISDWRNYCLKKLDRKDFKVVEQLAMGGVSYCICAVGKSEIAVPIARTIQFVSVTPSMTKSTSFSCSHGVYDLKFSSKEDNLYVSTGSETIYVYNKQGSLLKNFDFPGKTSKHIAFLRGRNGYDLLITDETCGLYALTTSGTMLWKYTDPALQRAWGVTVLPGNIILVSGLTSHNVLQLNKDGKKISTLIDASQNVNRPFALAYDNGSSKLLVGCKSESLNVFTLSGQ